MHVHLAAWKAWCGLPRRNADEELLSSPQLPLFEVAPAFADLLSSAALVDFDPAADAFDPAPACAPAPPDFEHVPNSALPHCGAGAPLSFPN